MPDLNIRGVPQSVLDRLREQAEVEGVSVSEWVRAALADRALLSTTTELAVTRSRLAEFAQPAEDFERYYNERLHRRLA